MIRHQAYDFGSCGKLDLRSVEVATCDTRRVRGTKCDMAWVPAGSIFELSRIPQSRIHLDVSHGQLFNRHEPARRAGLMTSAKEKVFTAGHLDNVNAAHPHMVRAPTSDACHPIRTRIGRNMHSDLGCSQVRPPLDIGTRVLVFDVNRFGVSG